MADGTVRAFGQNNGGQLGVNDTTNRLTPVTVLNITSATVIAGGSLSNHTAVLLADGTIRTFGANVNGQLGVNDNTNRSTPVQVLNITSATNISSGFRCTFAFLADGTIRAFGANSNGGLGINDTTDRSTPVQVFGISSSAVAVGGGRLFSAVLLSDGSVRTFGLNSSGQLGVGDTASRLTPVQVVSGFSSVLGRVAGGYYHTAVVMGDGTVRTFGRNTNGQLGLGDTVTRLTPVQISGMTSATAVACGFYHTAVLLIDGTVRTFGRNNVGQLGLGDTTSRLTPVQVTGITSATAVAGGTYFTAVLLNDGTIRTFGFNGSGQLGVGDNTSRQTPVQVLNITSGTALATGGRHVAVLLTNGTMRTFGDNTSGQLGVNDTTTRNTPVQVFGISSSATAVGCGVYHTGVILTDGTVRTFGANNNGNLGVNDTTQRNTPVQVFGISSSAVAIAGGRYHTAVLLGNGTVQTFGRNTLGQLGLGDTTQRNTPVTVLNVTSATALASGLFHTIVLLADGTVRTVGLNDAGQLGVADTVNRLIPVKVGVSGNKVGCGYYHTAVLSNDGTVRTFGMNNNGQLGLNDNTNRLTPVQVTGITSVTMLSAGYAQNAVLLNNGTVWGWGTNYSGELGINISGGSRGTPVQMLNISNAIAVVCGTFQTAVLLANGTIWTCGRNGFGQLGTGDTTSRLTPVQVSGITSATSLSIGKYFMAIVLSDGTVRTLGFNDYGNLGINVVGGSRLTPVQVWGISSSAVAVACQNRHMAVLLADGTVRTFGANASGQLGVNDATDRATPVQVVNISTATYLGTFGYSYFTAVLLADGTVRTFGANGNGQLGVGDTASRLTPVQVLNITSATTVAPGGYHAAVLLTDGTVRTFGGNARGQLGVNDTTSRLTPVQVLTAVSYGGGVGKVAGGYVLTAVVLADGTVRTVGDNGIGQLGVNDTIQRSTPVQVWGISSSATAVACGYFHTAVLLANGTVRTFGGNPDGNLGINDTTSRLTPVQVFGISSSAVAVAGGQYLTAVLLADGTVRTFGTNTFGQLGVNDTTSRLTPVQVFGISSSATAIACGRYFTAVLLANGTVWTFGRNQFGQLGINDTTSRLTPVQVWGISSSATAIACGESHTAVLLANGTVMAFGNNNSGRLGNGDTTQRNTPVDVLAIGTATAVACGRYHTVILLSNGTVRTFGRGWSGQLGINEYGNNTISRVVAVQVWGISSSATAVACGGYHTAVLIADGTVRTFGENFAGPLGVNDKTARPTPVTVLNIANAGSLASTTFLTNATAIVIPLSSASTPVASFLLSTAAIITYPYVQFPALNLGPVTYPQYQLELTTDYARKLTTSTWTIGSDERLKTDIETANVDRCVEIVQNLDLKYFKWEFPDAPGGQSPTDAHSLGWIAQEFAQFFPRSVDEAPAHGIMDFKNLNSDQIIKVMWGALKKLRADLKSQKSSDSELSTAGDNASPTPE